MSNSETEPVRGFMDGIDWEYHLGSDASGARIYPSERSCRRDNACIATGGCGLVEVEVRFIRWVEPQDLRIGYRDENPTPLTENEDEDVGCQSASWLRFVAAQASIRGLVFRDADGPGVQPHKASPDPTPLTDSRDHCG